MKPSETPGTDDSTLEVTWRFTPRPFTVEVGSPESGARARLEPGSALTLGSGRDVSVRIADRTVSACHCAVKATPRGLAVEDCGSLNGVFVGGARVKSALLSGAIASFVIGHTSVVVREVREGDDEVAQARVPGLVGCSEAMQRVAREIVRHAALRAPVLIQGESGTGKDVVARGLHELGRRSGAYVPLNVGAISESLADAELFGHKKGAFTGAIAARPGAFEQAQKGTLFLDEVAELSPSLQVKLLRVVEDGLVRPLGAVQPVRVDVRLVSATWASLAERVQEGRFRADLYHRLSTVVIELPPLRQRRSDIPALAQAWLLRFEAELGPKRLTSAALAKLVDYRWPGNVRELGSALYRAAVASSGAAIDACHVRLVELSDRPPRATALTPSEVLALFERHRKNTTAAARAARVPRSTFRAWLDKARATE